MSEHADEKKFDFDEWSAPDFITARPFKKYIDDLKASLTGTQISAIHTMGAIFNNWDYEEIDEWDAKGYIMLDEPVVFICGEKQLEICFYNTSHAKIGINTLKMTEKSYQHEPWRNISRVFPHIIGRKISDIKLMTSTKGFYDSVFMGDGSRPDGGDYFDELILILENDFVLVLYGSCEYMHIFQVPKNNIKLFPTHSRVYISGDEEHADISPYLSFVPYANGKETGQNVLRFSEDDWIMLYWSIRYIFFDYDMYEINFSINIFDWERIISAWGFVFSANTFDEVFERFCGIDYDKRTIKNESLMYYLNHTGYLWKNRDSAWEIYSDFIEWFSEIKNDCTHINIYGI